MNSLGLNESSSSTQLDMASGEILVAEVVVETHPVMTARVLISGKDSAARPFEDWLPCLEGLHVKAGDKVLVQRPANMQEPLVTGIVQSAHSRRRQPHTAHTLALVQDESLTINDHHGKPIVDIVSDEHGPTVMLHTTLAELDIAGTLRLEADSLQLKARQGEMTLSASGDIKVDGEMIKLN